MTQIGTDGARAVRSADNLHADITGAVIGAAMEVHNALGPGFLESVYETALAHELELRGFQVQRQARMQVSYKTIVAGEFVPDLLVNGCVVVELKATQENHSVYEAIIINQLKVSGLRVALLLNFGRERLYFRRFVQ